MPSEDGKRVVWGTTIRFLLVTSVAAGLVATAIIVVAGVPWEQLRPGSPLPPLYLLPLAWPALVLFIFAGFYMCGKIWQFMGQVTGIPFMVSLGSLTASLATLAAFLACIIGDPLVWLINKVFPSLTNIRDLKFINPYFFIYVYDPDGK